LRKNAIYGCTIEFQRLKPGHFFIELRYA